MFTLGFSITTAAISSLSEVSKSGAIFTNTGVLLFAKESLATSTLLIKASRACFPCNLLNPGVFGLKLIGKGKKTSLFTSTRNQFTIVYLETLITK